MTGPGERSLTPSPGRPAPGPGPAAALRRQPLWRLIAGLAVVLAGCGALAVPALVLTRADRGDAAFTGEVAVWGRISSATLDVEAGTRTTPIAVGALAPGDRAAGTLEVVNAGSLPLRYALAVEPSDTEAERWLRWNLWPAPAGQGCGRLPTSGGLLAEDLVLAGPGQVPVVGDAATGLDPGDRLLAPGASELLCLQVALPLGVPDSAQGNPVAPVFIVEAEQATGGSGP